MTYNLQAVNTVGTLPLDVGIFNDPGGCVPRLAVVKDPLWHGEDSTEMWRADKTTDMVDSMCILCIIYIYMYM
jgi:hypothetical protein